MAYKDKYNNRHHSSNDEDINMNDVETISNSTSEEETLVIEANNNPDEVIQDCTILDIKPVEEESVKMEEEVVITNIEEESNNTQKEIDKLEENIKSWEAQLKRSRNNIMNAELHDKIMGAQLKIRELKINLPPIKANAVNPAHASVSDRVISKRAAREDASSYMVRIL